MNNIEEADTILLDLRLSLLKLNVQRIRHIETGGTKPLPNAITEMCQWSCIDEIINLGDSSYLLDISGLKTVTLS